MTKVLIVAACFYREITDAMIQGAREVLDNAGCNSEIIEVPGAFEIPAVISMAKDKYDGFIALGCVIRGETSHYDYVCLESARGLNDLAMKYHLPIGYGIITVENEQQAWERALPSRKNKGGFAAQACLRMLEIRKKLVV